FPINWHDARHDALTTSNHMYITVFYINVMCPSTTDILRQCIFFFIFPVLSPAYSCRVLVMSRYIYVFTVYKKTGNTTEMMLSWRGDNVFHIIFPVFNHLCLDRKSTRLNSSH